jgi:glutamate 5-kinase
MFEMVGKIGSMALIRREEGDIDYNIFSRLGAELAPGMVWVSSGATEIGRLDYIKRNGRELAGDLEEIKTDYAAQGQAILMNNYRQFIRPEYSVRQLLVEHTHFNDPEKRNHIKHLLTRAAQQGAIPIVNYNDAVSSEENRKMELSRIRESGTDPVECVDNDETAAVISELVGAKTLLILTSTDGIYLDPKDPSTLVESVRGRDKEELRDNIAKLMEHCEGASRAGAAGARAKLQYTTKPALNGTRVIIGSPRFRLSQLLNGTAPATRIEIIQE